MIIREDSMKRVIFLLMNEVEEILLSGDNKVKDKLISIVVMVWDIADMKRYNINKYMVTGGRYFVV